MHRRTSLSLLALALAYAAQPSAAQDARSCVDEVQRLSEAFPLTEASGQADAAIAQEPSARQGASLGDEQRRQIGNLVQQARTAGERGDGKQCIQSLTEARALLRQAGLGSSQPGMASGGGSGTRTGGSNIPDSAAGTSSVGTSPSDAAGGTTGVGTVGGAGALGGAAGPAAGSPAGRSSTGGGAPGGATGGTAGGAAGGSTGGGTSSSGGGGR